MSEALLVTGAAGRLGRAVVRAARAAGLPVIAHLRDARAALPEWDGDRGIEVVAYDLAEEPEALDPTLSRAGCVIHAAGAMRGDDAHHARQTVAPTRHIVERLARVAPRAALVHVSSVTVHDAMVVAPGGLLDETTPLEATGAGRDAYCRAKLAQERIVQAARGVPRLILRPGLLVSGNEPGWNPHLGLRLGPVTLALSRGGEVPTCHVDACAAALLQGATLLREGRAGDDCPAYILVDDERPGRDEMLRELRARGESGPVVALPFALADTVARVLSPLPLRPGIVRRPVLHARLKPLRYSNARARAALGWQPARRGEGGADA